MTGIKQAPKPFRSKKQVVAGFVVFRRAQEGIKFLLLYRRGSYWNFPKGHFETGENSLATALRETEEETGIKPSELHIIPGFRAYETFTFQSGNERIHDTVILYLAETRQANVRIAPREHSGFAWFLYEDALKALGPKYIGTRRVLRLARDFLRRRNARLPVRQVQRPLSPHRHVSPKQHHARAK